MLAVYAQCGIPTSRCTRKLFFRWTIPKKERVENTVSSPPVWYYCNYTMPKNRAYVLIFDNVKSVGVDVKLVRKATSGLNN